MKNKLIKTVYLAGTMAGLKDLGASWRSELKPQLSTFKIDSFSPPENESFIVTKYKCNPYDLNSNPQKYSDKLRKEIFTDIIKLDLEFIRDKSDAIVCYYTKPSIGTCSELTWAKMLGIPVYLVNGSGERLPGWVLACVTKEFKTFNALKCFLKKYNQNIRSIKNAKRHKQRQAKVKLVAA